MSILYVVATPIGNLLDISARAIEILKSVDLIAAEDTRHSLTLLRSAQVNNPLISLHEHNEIDRSQELISLLLQGKKIALISDAGTPLMSDPGYHLVKLAREKGIPVSPIPGPCAAIAALSAAGLPSDRFCFEGFLPHKSSARLSTLKALEQEMRTIIFYESSHRIVDTLHDMKIAFGEHRWVVIARELTKTYETIYGDELSKVIEWIEADSQQTLGEFVILVKGANKIDDHEKTKRNFDILNILLQELSVKQAVDLATKITGAAKNELYAWAIKQKTIES
jgi:16S rRNA (cytidine1402-2'-O)-methyltransferase